MIGYKARIQYRQHAFTVSSHCHHIDLRFSSLFIILQSNQLFNVIDINTFLLNNRHLFNFNFKALLSLFCHPYNLETTLTMTFSTSFFVLLPLQLLDVVLYSVNPLIHFINREDRKAGLFLQTMIKNAAVPI